MHDNGSRLPVLTKPSLKTPSKAACECGVSGPSPTCSRAILSTLSNMRGRRMRCATSATPVQSWEHGQGFWRRREQSGNIQHIDLLHVNNKAFKSARLGTCTLQSSSQCNTGGDGMAGNAATPA